ncbi:MAG: hypothetical protein BWK72_12925 [Rhodoferax ferrireducens]|uniref:Transcription factor zinc-finger domain-containing protein n=1 Tax=Rhodoferax ferrireducens TaxID=192843 RepID=A0A1W9KST6_9BURK|nr:MAG: hypothetical protein BWK72_12925 [Rhodoferax ferrireducens]
MKCPNCPDTSLVMADRQGVEIDYCPACRGIWLDRGELDKLLDRAAAATAAPVVAQTTRPRQQPDLEDSDDRHGQRHHTSRKKSWLSEIFD